MSSVNYYVIDTSSLIELNRRYPVDVFPRLWGKIEELIKRKLLVSHKEVLKEISVMDDSLKKWAKKQKGFFRETDDKQLPIVRELLAKYPSLAKSDNQIAAADPFVIALAVVLSKDTQQKTLTNATKSHLIVTEEKLRGMRIRIPLVCQNYNIQCIEIIQMMRNEGWKF